MPTFQLSRYVKLALIGAAALWLPACGSPAAAPTATPTAVVVGPTAIQIAVATDDFAVGAPRIPLVLFDGPDEVADAQAVHLTAFDLSGDPPAAGWSGPATNYSDYEVPYWVAYPDLPHNGLWGFQATISLADGSQTEAQFTIQVNEQTATPAVGAPAPASENRTAANEPDLSKLTSDPNPEPALYQMTVAAALQSGKPTVVTLATPAFCQTRICTPVVDSVKAVYRQHSEEVNFIHLEIYKDFSTLEPADEVEQWGLTSEPWTFVVAADGRISARFGGPLSPRELSAALDEVLKKQGDAG